MALHNPAMDHRITTTLARFALAYVFVYYYVFVYVVLHARLVARLCDWRDRAAGLEANGSRRLLILSIGCGLLAGAYLDPAMLRLGASDALLDEVRMRDIPFWFSFVALGALTAMFADLSDQGMRRSLLGAMLAAYMIYAAVRILGLGDAAAYDSIAFFSMQPCSASRCSPSSRDRRCSAGSARAATSSISGTSSSSWRCAITPRCVSSAAIAGFAVCCGLTVLLITAALLVVRQLASPRALPLAGGLSMLLKHTLLYLPAQFVGPLFQLLAMIVWTHVVDEHTLGIITLITATHELLQIGFLAWWSQYALRFFGRYQDGNDAPRFYRTENAVLLASIALQSAAVIGILLLVIAPDARTGLLACRCRLCDYPVAQRLYRRARPRAAADPGLHDPAGIRAVGRICHRPGVDQIVRPIGGVAACGIRRGATDRGADRDARAPPWLPPVADRPGDRHTRAALRHPADHRRRARLGRPQCVALHRQRNVGSGRSRTVRGRLRPRPARRGGRGHAGDGGRVPAGGKEHGAGGQPGRHAPACRQQRAAGRDPGAEPRRHLHAENGDRASLDRSAVPGGDARRPAALHARRRDPQPARPFRRSGVSAAEPHALDDGRCGDRRVDDGGAERPVPAALGTHGCAGATVLAALAAASVSFSIGFTQFGLRLPVGHLVRIALATIAMAALLRIFPEARSIAVLAAHVAAGAAVYFGSARPALRTVAGADTPRHAPSIWGHERIQFVAYAFRVFSNARAIANQSGFFCIDESNGSGRGSRCASGSFFFAASV